MLGEQAPLSVSAHGGKFAALFTLQPAKGLLKVVKQGLTRMSHHRQVLGVIARLPTFDALQPVLLQCREVAPQRGITLNHATIYQGRVRGVV